MPDTTGYAVLGGNFYNIRETGEYPDERDETWLAFRCTVEEAAEQCPEKLARAEYLDDNPNKYPIGRPKLR